MKTRWIVIIGVSSLIALLILSYFIIESLYNYYTFTDVFKNHINPLHIVDIHYDPVEKPKLGYYSTIEDITRQDDNSINIQFSQPEFQYSNGYNPIPVFTSYYGNIRINQTFVVSCVNFVKDGQAENFPDLEITDYPSISILKYLGPDIKNEIPVYKFLHASTSLTADMPCDYPEIIEHSIDAIPVYVPDGFEEK